MAKHKKREQSGQGLVEFALILPVLLLILVGVFEFGRALFIYSNLFNAAREGVRYGVTSPRDYNGIRDASASRVALAPVNPVENPFDPDGVWIVVQYDNGPGTPAHTDVTYLTAGDRVRVNVRYNIRAMTPFFQPIFGANGIALDSRATRTIQTTGVIVNPPPTAPPGYGDGGEISLSPTCGDAGTQTITVNGTGWDNDTRVDVFFEGTSVFSNQQINPTFSLTFTRDNVQAGSYTVRVVGRQTASAASATYTVPCPAEPPPTPTTEPSPTPTEAPPSPTPTEGPSPTPTDEPPPPTPTPPLIAIDKPVNAGDTSVTGSAQPGQIVTLRVVQTGLQVSVGVESNGQFTFSNLPPLQAGMTIIVQGYGQQDTAIVEGNATPTPTPTPAPTGAYITITPSCGPIGDQTITVNFYNWTPPPGGFYITIYFNEERRYNGQNKIDQSNFEQAFNASNIVVGVHTVRAEARSQKDGSGTEHHSYSVSFTSPCPVPDLVVSQLQLSTDPPLGTYERIDFDVQVTNQGGGDIASLFWVDLFANTDPDPYTYASVDYVAINGLPAGASINFTMWVEAGFATTGDHTLTALVDTWNQILESDEDNNTASLDVTVTETNTAPPPTPIVPPGTGRISGLTYIDQSGPQSLVNVYIYDSEGRLVWSGFSSTVPTAGGIRQGYYEAEGLPEGNLTVIGQMRTALGLYWGYATVNLAPGGTLQNVDIYLTLQP